MAQLFRPSANARVRLALWGLGLAPVALGGVAWTLYSYEWGTGADRFVNQPIPFSHEHHVGGVGLDCRYCHLSVEDAAFAGIPPTEICMHCHAQLFADAPMLAPVRASFAEGRPLVWRRVHDLPDFVYFDHSAHVGGGVGCETCHGRVDRMPLVRQTAPLTMSWCVDCHDDPSPRLRPRDAVFTMGWTPDGRAPAEVETHTSCSECHR